MRTPDWDRWTKDQEARAWECLALSVDVDPRELGIDHFLVMRACTSALPLGTADDPAWLKEICRRLSILVKLGHQHEPPFLLGEDESAQLDSRLVLSGFVTWAIECKWDLPDELSALQAPQPKAAAKPEKPAARKSKAKTAAKPATRKEGKAPPKTRAKAAATADAKPTASRRAHEAVIVTLLAQAGIDPKAPESAVELKALIDHQGMSLSERRLRAVITPAGGLKSWGKHLGAKLPGGDRLSGAALAAHQIVIAALLFPAGIKSASQTNCKKLAGLLKKAGFQLEPVVVGGILHGALAQTNGNHSKKRDRGK